MKNVLELNIISTYSQKGLKFPGAFLKLLVVLLETL